MRSLLLLSVLTMASILYSCSSSRQVKIAISPVVTSLLDEAQSHLGSPYCLGGTSRDCFDCSGFVSTCFSTIGVMLPRTSREIASFGMAVARDSLQAGDVVAFRTSGRDVNHVGIMVDPQRFIHASTSKGVIVSALSETYWNKSYISARRVVQR